MPSPKVAHGRKVREVEIANRRRTVVANLLAGATYREIASVLSISISTIHEDIQVMLDELTSHYLSDVDRWRVIQLRRYDMLLNAVWEGARGTSTIEPNKEKMNLILSIMDRQNRLLGLDEFKAQ